MTSKKNVQETLITVISEDGKDYISLIKKLNAVVISDGIPQREGFKRLNQMTIRQMSIPEEVENRKLLKKNS